MNSVIALGICIIIAAVIVVIGIGYFSARSSLQCQLGAPNCVKNFISATTTVYTTSISTSTSVSTTTTIHYVGVVPISTINASLGLSYYDGDELTVNGTYAIEHFNKTSGVYVVTNNPSALGYGSHNQLNLTNNPTDWLPVYGYGCNEGVCGGALEGINYSFTGVLNCNGDWNGRVLCILNVSKACSLNASAQTLDIPSC